MRMHCLARFCQARASPMRRGLPPKLYCACATRFSSALTTAYRNEPLIAMAAPIAPSGLIGVPNAAKLASIMATRRRMFAMACVTWLTVASGEEGGERNNQHVAASEQVASRWRAGGEQVWRAGAAAERQASGLWAHVAD